MKNFDDWYTELTSNYVWFSPASLHHKPETFRSVANKVYMQYVAQEVFPPIQEARRHVYNKLALIPGDRPKIDWSKKALEQMDEQKKEDWKPVSEEKRAEYLNQIQEIIKGSTMMTAVPRASRMDQVAEAEGQWLPKKPAPYPQTSEQEAYVRKRHLEYVRLNYEPRTGAKLPEWTDEEIFNIQYDHEYDEALSKIKKTRNP